MLKLYVQVSLLNLWRKRERRRFQRLATNWGHHKLSFLRINSKFGRGYENVWIILAGVVRCREGGGAPTGRSFGSFNLIIFINGTFLGPTSPPPSKTPQRSLSVDNRRKTQNRFNIGSVRSLLLKPRGT